MISGHLRRVLNTCPLRCNYGNVFQQRSIAPKRRQIQLKVQQRRGQMCEPRVLLWTMLCVVGIRRRCRATPGTPAHAIVNFAGGATRLTRFRCGPAMGAVAGNEGSRHSRPCRGRGGVRDRLVGGLYVVLLVPPDSPTPTRVVCAPQDQTKRPPSLFTVPKTRPGTARMRYEYAVVPLSRGRDLYLVNADKR